MIEMVEFNVLRTIERVERVDFCLFPLLSYSLGCLVLFRDIVDLANCDRGTEGRRDGATERRRDGETRRVIEMLRRI